MTNVILTAKVRARPGRETEAVAWLITLLEPTRAEPGCLFYDLYAERDDPGEILFHEGWASQKALEDHLAGTGFAEFQRGAKLLLDGDPTLTFYSKL